MGYANVSGCVTRRYSDLSGCGQLQQPRTASSCRPCRDRGERRPDGAAIEARQASGRLRRQDVAHPIMRESKDLQIFLEEQDKASWSERVLWPRGASFGRRAGRATGSTTPCDSMTRERPRPAVPPRRASAAWRPPRRRPAWRRQREARVAGRRPRGRGGGTAPQRPSQSGPTGDVLLGSGAPISGLARRRYRGGSALPRRADYVGAPVD